MSKQDEYEGGGAERVMMLKHWMTAEVERVRGTYLMHNVSSTLPVWKASFFAQVLHSNISMHGSCLVSPCFPKSQEN